MPFRLAPLKKRVAPVREPWKAVTTPEGSLPSLAKEAASIGAWVPSPKIDQEETLPQIEEIADRIARRYVGGLAKLDEVQRAWRKKQDALRRKKQRAGHDQAPILPPSARDDSGSPRTHSGARTAREMRDARSPETSLSGAPFRSNSGSPPRRKNKKKTWQMRASEVEVNAPEEEEQDQETIKDVLKSGLGDLFHQKREVYHDEDPALDGARSDSLQIPQRNLSGGRMSEAEDDDRFDSFDQGHSQGHSASDVDPASSSNSMNVEDFHKVSKRSNGPRKTTVVGPMGSKKNHRMHRMQEAAPADDGQHERHGRELSFATCSELAKKHRLTVPMVRQSLEEFLSLDKNGDGRLSFEEFEQAIRDRCSIKADEATPMHLLHLNWSKADKDNDAEINFEEFLLWSTEHLFTEELVVADPKERYMRELARKFNLPLDQVERCYKTFLNSDSNRNGFIEEAEFRNCVAVLWNCDMEDIPATRFRQFWLEADKARLGKLSFEVFLIWYLTIGVR